MEEKGGDGEGWEMGKSWENHGKMMVLMRKSRENDGTCFSMDWFSRENFNRKAP